jgi:hypothetical protein
VERRSELALFAAQLLVAEMILRQRVRVSSMQKFESVTVAAI